MACWSPIAWPDDPTVRATLAAHLGHGRPAGEGCGPVVLTLSDNGAGAGVFALEHPSRAGLPGAEAEIARAAAAARSRLTEVASLAACTDAALPALRPLYFANGEQKIVAGGSLGLSVALWAAGRALHLDLSCDAAIGRVDDSGAVLRVEGAAPKLHALQAVGVGLSRIWAPTAMRAELEPVIAARWPGREVELVCVNSLNEAIAQLAVEASHTLVPASEAERRAQLADHLRAAVRGGPLRPTAPLAALTMLRAWRAASVEPWDRWAADWALAIAERHAGFPARCPPLEQPACSTEGMSLGVGDLCLLHAHLAQTHADAPGAEGAAAVLDQLATVAAERAQAGAPASAAGLFGAIGRAALMVDADQARRCAERAARLWLSEDPALAGHALCAWLIAAEASGLGRPEALGAARKARAAWGRGVRDDVREAFLDLAEARALLGDDPAGAQTLVDRVLRAQLPGGLEYLRRSALRVGWLAGPATAPTPPELLAEDGPYGAIYLHLHQIDRALRAGDRAGLVAARSALLEPGGGKSPQLLAVLVHLLGGVALSATAGAEGAEGADVLEAKLRCFPY